MKQEILSVLPGDHPWQNHIICYNEVTSTNDLAKAMANQGVPDGTVLVAKSQTAGRGRLGRTFHAPDGLGVYLSVILRPDCTPEQLMHLTCATAVAMCNAVEACSGLRPQIKWTNDLVAGNKKLGGILTELSVNSVTGKVDWVVVGVGINCCQQAGNFPPDIKNIATSLLQWSKKHTQPEHLAGYMIDALYQMRNSLLTCKNDILSTYRKDCMTVGRQTVLIRGDEKQYGTALDIDDNGGLVVQFDNGSVETVQSGEISVRGLYGYV